MTVFASAMDWQSRAVLGRHDRPPRRERVRRGAGRGGHDEPVGGVGREEVAVEVHGQRTTTEARMGKEVGETAQRAREIGVSGTLYPVGQLGAAATDSRLGHRSNLLAS